MRKIWSDFLSLYISLINFVNSKRHLIDLFYKKNYDTLSGTDTIKKFAQIKLFIRLTVYSAKISSYNF